jgi:carbon-monoxide dehydrogenase small subunit
MAPDGSGAHHVSKAAQDELLTVTLHVNGCEVTSAVDPRTTLALFVREHLRLIGTRMGCDTAQCGACTVLLDGKAVKSCNVLVAQAQGRSVVTIEGLPGGDGALHSVQECFRKHHALQCGFCTSGMVMRTCELLATLSSPTDREIREALEGNLCRCTGYLNIVAAVRDAFDQQARKAPTEPAQSGLAHVSV